MSHKLQRHNSIKPTRPSPLSEPSSSTSSPSLSSISSSTQIHLPSSRKRDSQGNVILRENNKSGIQIKRHIRHAPVANSSRNGNFYNSTNNDNDNNESYDDQKPQNQKLLNHEQQQQQVIRHTETNSINDEYSDSNGEEEEEENDSDSSDYHKTGIPPQLMEKLATFPLFKNAPKAFHKAIAGRLKLVQHHAQEYIVKFGEPAKAMYWILRGSVAVTSPDGEAVHTELIPGQFFGEIGILFNRPRTATVIARTKVLLGVLTVDNFNAVLPDFPKIERMIRDEAQERLSMQDKRIRNGVTNILPRLSGNGVSDSGLVDNSLGSSASNMATAIASIPGPSIPPKVRSPSPDNFHVANFSSLPSSLIETSKHFTQEYNKTHLLPKIHDNVDHSIPTRDFLRSLPMFTLLPSNMIHELVLGVEPRRYEPFEYIFKKGDSGRDIFFVVNGEVEVLDPKRVSIVNHHSGNKEKKVDTVLARLSTGQYFGEMAFLNSIQKIKEGEEVEEPQRSADIRSITTVDLLVVTGDQLESLYSRYPQIVNEMKETANKRTDSNQADLDYTNRVISSNSHQQSSFQVLQGPFESKEQQKSGSNLFGTFNKWNGFGSENSSKKSKHESNDCPLEYETPMVSNKLSISSSHTELFSPSYSLSQPYRKYSVSSTESLNIDDDLKFKRRLSHMAFPIPSYTTSSSVVPLQLNPPQMNRTMPSINQFPPPTSRPQTPFEYMSHAKRLMLTSLAAGRRRSSVLSTLVLPDRLLLQVFKFLTLPELMKLRLICRRWRQLLYVAPGFFETLDLKRYNRTIDDNALRQITDFVGSRPKIIDISNCFHITDIGFCYMVNEIGMSGSIKIIKMTSVWEVSAMAIMDVSVPSIGHHLEELDLSNCKKVRDDVIERVIGYWKDGVNLFQQQQQQRHVHCHSDLEPVPGMEEFDQSSSSTAIAAGCQNIKRLNLGYCKHLTDRTMYHIAMYASSKLESLDLTRCTSITDVGFAYWAYQPFPKLHTLKLSDCTFLTDKSIIALASTACELKSLDLSFCCALTDVSVEVLCLGCPKLQSLDLSFCGSAVSDSTLLGISVHLRDLQRLVIKGCIRVTRAGVDALLTGSKGLKYLDISQCRNAHVYRNNVPAAIIMPGRGSKSAFVRNTLGNVVEIVI